MISLEYVAGFFDGEGSIGVYYHKNPNGNKGFHLRTQLTQNKGIVVSEIMNFLITKYGGNLGEITNSSTNKVKYNWQLNSNAAVVFLRDIEPFLQLKKEQARIAIWWQEQRPKLSRNKKGQLMIRDTKDFDTKIALLVKLLKTQELNQVMENQKDLVTIIKILEPVVNIKA